MDQVHWGEGVAPHDDTVEEGVYEANADTKNKDVEENARK